MKNFEYWEEEILKFMDNNKDASIAVVNDKLHNCASTRCCDCLFVGGNCSIGIIRWLYAEHIEKPKLTQKERAFCELVETGWIARDASGYLFHCNLKPVKQDKNSLCYTSPDDSWEISLTYNENPKIKGVVFDFINWEDEEPWSVEELLKLEVE